MRTLTNRINGRLAFVLVTSSALGLGCETDTEGLLRRPAPPMKEEPMMPEPDVDAVLTTRLAGSYWTSSIEGSIGTYLTWYSFESDGDLVLTEELRPAQEGASPEFSIGGTGRWIVRDGFVELDWEGDRWSPAGRRYSARWVYSPAGDALSELLYSPLRAGDSDAWSDTVFTVADQDETRFVGEWHFSTEDVERRAIERHGRRVEIRFDRSLRAGDVSTVAVEIEPYVTRDETESRDRREFAWSCGAEPIADTALIGLRVRGFEGDRWAIRSAWSAELFEQGVRDDVRDEIIRGFIPSLVFDPNDPTRVASLPTSAPLMTRQLQVPAEVSER